MLKAGIFVDADNIMRNGGFGLRYKKLRELVEAQGIPVHARRANVTGATVVRATAYMSIDEEREQDEPFTRHRREQARQAIRRAGFKLELKPIKRYGPSTIREAMTEPTEEREQSVKANIDVDLTVDALMQAGDLDYFMLVTGDGDFTKLVQALQSKGKKVDLLAFMNVSRELKEAVDVYFNGFLMPGILPAPKEDPNVHTGFVHYVDEDKGFGFMTMYTGLGSGDIYDNIYVNEKSFANQTMPLSMLRQRGAVLEFDIDSNPAVPNRQSAKNVNILTYDNQPVFL